MRMTARKKIWQMTDEERELEFRRRELQEAIDEVLREEGVAPGTLWVSYDEKGVLYINDERVRNALAPHEATPEGVRQIAREWALAVRGA